MNSAKHKEQKVAVFVDVQNMYYSAKNLYSAKVNYSNVLEDAVSARKLIRAFTYVIKADIDTEKDFFDALEKIGFEVRSKDLQIFFGGAKKGDWDVGLCMDAVRLLPKIDVMVLVSGDGDYTDLVDYARSQGVRTEIFGFGKTTSSKLIEEADEFVDLSENKRRYLIKVPSRSKTKSGAKGTNNSKSE
ncbi:MAG: NYN domain-containing protein [Paludibacteraceae bacterium]|nr:NYN domain-containing protein [Paludibacteraceae bacterium]